MANGKKQTLCCVLKILRSLRQSPLPSPLYPPQDLEDESFINKTHQNSTINFFFIPVIIIFKISWKMSSIVQGFMHADRMIDVVADKIFENFFSYRPVKLRS